MVQDLVETEGRLTMARSELQQSHQTLEQKQERLQEVEARSRELYDTTVRLEAHIADLESRKRAPLYQKKQEEELKAAIEKAQECEIRAVDAEMKHKEAKVCLRTETWEVKSRVYVSITSFGLNPGHELETDVHAPEYVALLCMGSCLLPT